jgi:DNA polymerase-3 subunit epsilon
MAREIVLDTETTGLDPKSGHRVIEIACIEIEDLLPTGRNFHRYIDPEREIDPEAEKVHGISRASLHGRPKFHDAEICDAFLEFVADAPLIAHNAAFDRGFINHELERSGRRSLPEPRWICTYEMAKVRFPGMYNSLDALCKRFKISLAEREKHGALIDTRLLANGGYGARPRPLAARSTEAERAAHAAFIANTLKDKAVWLNYAEA